MVRTLATPPVISVGSHKCVGTYREAPGRVLRGAQRRSKAKQGEERSGALQPRRRPLGGVGVYIQGSSLEPGGREEPPEQPTAGTRRGRVVLGSVGLVGAMVTMAAVPPRRTVLT